MSKIIISGENFLIQPSDINGKKHFFNAFGNSETEVSADWIVRFLQERGQSWKPFSYQDINTFYSRKFDHGFNFNRLLGGGWIILTPETGQYYLTEEFVVCCHRASPVSK